MSIRRILVVEDESLIANLVVQALRSLDGDLDIDVVADGEQAIKAVHAQPTDLVICDVVMPHMDGMRVARYIAEQPRLARTAIVMLTSASRAKLDNVLAIENVRAYIQKPIGFKDLKLKLNEVLVSLDTQRPA